MNSYTAVVSLEGKLDPKGTLVQVKEASCALFGVQYLLSLNLQKYS